MWTEQEINEAYQIALTMNWDESDFAMDPQDIANIIYLYNGRIDLYWDDQQ